MKVRIKSVANGKYVTAEQNEPNTPLTANRELAQSWEEFEIEVLEADPNPKRLLWKGFSDFRLAQAQMAGEDIKPILAQRLDLGANLVRVFGMKANNTGWDLVPQARPDYFGDIARFVDTMIGSGLKVEWVVFADTKAIMPEVSKQIDFYHETCQTMLPYAEHVYVELCNEWDHPTQKLNPSAFNKFDGLKQSHGSGQTDADTVRPRWDYATYHARRDGARGFTNYDPYEFQSVYPQPCPLIPDEGAKPENYSYDTDYARLMGLHAANGWGGTFHTSQGVNSVLLGDRESACAKAFFGALDG